MEPISFIVGATQLSTVFTACLELTELIQIGQNLGFDYQVLYTKFLVLRYRFSIWGRLLPDLQHSHQWTAIEEQLFGEVLVLIQKLFSDTKILKQKYDRNSGHLQHVPQMRSVQGIDSSGLDELQAQFDIRTIQRQKSTSLKRKTTWAIRDRATFEKLITDFEFYVNQLEQITQKIRATDMQLELAERMNLVRTPEAWNLLEAATLTRNPTRSVTARDILYTETVPEVEEMEITDSDAEEYSGNSASSNATSPEEPTQPRTKIAHQFVNNVVTDRALLFNGDVGKASKYSRAHLYTGTQISGDAKVIQGNTEDTGAILAFFWAK